MNEHIEAGGLLTTTVETVDLGEHHGAHLEGRVTRRTLRIGFGGRRGLRLELARVRATSVLVRGGAGVQTPGGEAVQTPGGVGGQWPRGEGEELVRIVPVNPDPWIVTMQRLLALTVLSAILPWMVRRGAGFARPGSE